MGPDAEHLRRLAGLVGRAAERADVLAGRLRNDLDAVVWESPRADRARARGAALTGRLRSGAEHLSAAAGQLRQVAAEVEGGERDG